MEHSGDYDVNEEGAEFQDNNPDDSPNGLWKLHRIAETNPEAHEQILKVLGRLQPCKEELVLPELVEDVIESQGAPPKGPQRFKKLTVLVTGPVMVPIREDKIARILWDDVAQVLLREDCLAGPITMRLLPAATPKDLPVLLTIIAAGGSEDWEGMRIMSRANPPECLEESGMLLRSNRQQAMRLLSVALDSVDACLYCDRLHKYHLTLADQDLIKKLSSSYGQDLWRRTALCFTNDGYSFPPVGMSFGDFVARRTSAVAQEVASNGIRVRSRRAGGFLGLVGGRRLYSMPSCVVDGNEMFLPPNEDGSPAPPVLPDGSWSPVNLLREVVGIANRGAAYEYNQRAPAPTEEIAERVVPLLVTPKPPKEEPKGPRPKKQPAGPGALGAGMPGFPGAQRPQFAPQAAQWEMLVQQDRLRLQDKRKDVEQRGWLRAILGRVASSDLKWLPYVIIAEVMLYRRVFLPLVEKFREKDLHYTKMEYEVRKAERAAAGMQPPRGLEVNGVYIDEPWSEGEQYVARLERLKQQEIAKLKAGR